MVSLISSIRPHSPSIMTTSSNRIGSEKAICTPAMRFLSAGWAAAPTASAASPADAISDTPMVRTPGMAINIIAITRNRTTHCMMR